MGEQTETGAVVVYLSVSFLYVLLATTTNRFLLQRDDALIAEAAAFEDDRQRRNVLFRESTNRRSGNSDMLDPTQPLVTSHVPPKRSHVFHDYVCWFYLLIIGFTLTRAVICMASPLVGASDVMKSGQTRKAQDVVMLPSSIIYDIICVVLLHTFHYMSDAADPKPLSVYRRRLIFLISAVVVVVGVALLVTVLGSEEAGEYVHCAMTAVISSAFCASAIYLPSKILLYGGDELRKDANRVKFVSIIMACFLLLRAVAILPPMQHQYHIFEQYFTPVFFAVDFIPILVTLLVLHREKKITAPVNDSTPPEMDE